MCLSSNAISGPIFADFLFHSFKFRLTWHTSAVLAYLKPHHLHKALNLSTIFKIMHHFYLQHPVTCKHFDPRDVEHLLFLLESLAQVSLISNLCGRLPPLALVTAFFIQHFYTLIISTFFFSIMLLFLFLYLVVREINQVICTSNPLPCTLFEGFSGLSCRCPVCILVMISSISLFVPKQFMLGSENTLGYVCCVVAGIHSARW